MIIPNNFKRIIEEGCVMIASPPDLTVTEWANAVRMLPETANEPGRYRSSRTPNVSEIMDAFRDPIVEELTLEGSAQIAKTTILENIIGYTMDIQPQPILFMAPTKDVAKIFSKEKLEPMLELTPNLRKKVAKRKSRDSDNTTMYKRFTGGFIVFVGANSPHGLRQMSIPIVVSDDIDSIEIGSTKEGDPVDRAEKRSQTFEGRRKKIRASTPTKKKASRIDSFYSKGSQEEYYVKCLHCNAEQVLDFECIVWEKDQDVFGKTLNDYPQTAKIACKECGALHTESDRQTMLQTGRWIAKNPKNKSHRSFKINEISSTLSTLYNIVKAFVEIKGDVEKLETFTNLVLGEPFEGETVDEIEQASLMARVEDYIDPGDPYKIPNQILFVVSTADVQKDRIECNHWGVGFNQELYLIGRTKFFGNPDIVKSKEGATVWNELEKYNNVIYERKDGLKLKIMRRFVDSGYLSQSVYEYVRGRERLGYWAIKGRGQYGHPILARKFSFVDNGRTKLLSIGTNATKASIFQRLTVAKPGSKYIHFTESLCDEEYFDELTSEEGVKVTVSNLEFTVYRKKKSGIRNESLDLLVYAIAAIEHINPNYKKIKDNLDKKVKNLLPKPVEEVETVEEEKPDEDLFTKKKKKKQRHSRGINPTTNY